MEQSVLPDERGEILSPRSIGAPEGLQRYKGLYRRGREGGTAAAAAAPEIDLEEEIRQHVR